ncbi:ABC transporter, permease protein [Marvinbryantia formatexigens DSM 14469]|uniref:ABC transporter, permease protein n=1 Tax=Marvinbryantia formatexigens DSM 14469 TaxID=478749 RepID=C6L9A1_9FIRM|nr:carbohydrate ABC transporter permease [Marvinbryantia formatexigens]EET62840.1 ABC transporter, permease protein [Marvinbryantia formatexigens DSM 14469]UWO23185.1 carbohydrate ABC transporter permease [Marvinbryantia formatexigens DSM 14469]SDG02803.1 carbohydrate ABC transporter membrane protein 2, CUT1 family (TC 3.A.1.1.-) [Marvinbryantia formatexigens]
MRKEKMYIKKAKTPKDRVLRILLYLSVIVLVLVVLYPYFVMFTTALKSRAEIYSMQGTLLPIEWQWENFVEIWSIAPLARYFVNSIVISAGATAIAIICGIPAAYALSRMKFKGKKFFLGLVIVSQMFAPVVLLVGIYKVMSVLHMTDSLLGLIFINAAFNQAFAIWLLRGTFMSISAEMEQAATIDGCNQVQAMTRVLLPVAAPGIVTALIFVFINAWNEYTVALTLISSDLLKPLTVGITVFNGYNMIEWQYLFASSLFATIPVVILFICIEKHLVGGLTSGGVKG